MESRSFSLSPDELEAFDRDGFIGPFDLCGEAEMERNRRSFRPKLLNTKNVVYGRQTAGCARVSSSSSGRL